VDGHPDEGLLRCTGHLHVRLLVVGVWRRLRLIGRLIWLIGSPNQSIHHPLTPSLFKHNPPHHNY
jgi:hypothetical protein